MNWSLTNTPFRFKHWLTGVAVLFSFSSEALHLCTVPIALPGAVARRMDQFSLTLTLAAKRRSGSGDDSLSRGDQTRFLEEIQSAYRGVLQDSLDAQIIGPAEIAQLTKSQGRRVQCPTSGALVLATQDAIDLLVQHAADAQLSDRRLQNAFTDILTELFSTKATGDTRNAPSPKGKVARTLLPSLSLETGAGSSPRNLRLRFPESQDEVFASNAEGAIYRLPLLGANSKTEPKWELVFQAKPSASGGPIAFDVSRDGTFLAVDEQDALTFFDLQREKRLWSVPGQPKQQVALSPTGHWVTCLGQDAPVLLFDGKTGTARELRFKKNGKFGSNGYSLTSTDRWEKNLFKSVSFSGKGDRMFLKGAGSLNVELDLTKQKLSPRATFGGFERAELWGEFEDGRTVLTFASSNYVVQDGGAWSFQRGNVFEYGYVVSHPRTRNIFFTPHVWKPAAFVSIWELEIDWPDVIEVRTFNAVNRGEHAGEMEISQNGQLLVVQSDKATYFWNVQNPKSPKLIFRIAETFEDLDHSKAASLSTSGRYFTGVSSSGKFLTLDLSQHKNWPKPRVP